VRSLIEHIEELYEGAYKPKDAVSWGLYTIAVSRDMRKRADKGAKELSAALTKTVASLRKSIRKIVEQYKGDRTDIEFSDLLRDEIHNAVSKYLSSIMREYSDVGASDTEVWDNAASYLHQLIGKQYGVRL